jgi:hypothetical protein
MADCSLQTEGPLPRPGYVQMFTFEDHGELVSAVTHSQIAGPDRAEQHLADSAEHAVPDVVAVGVIDLFEIVNIEQQQYLRARFAISYLVQPRVEGATIVQAGERVDVHRECEPVVVTATTLGCDLRTGSYKHCLPRFPTRASQKPGVVQLRTDRGRGMSSSQDVGPDPEREAAGAGGSGTCWN